MFNITSTDGLTLATAPTLGTARATAERRSREVFGDVEVRTNDGDGLLRYRDGSLIGSMFSRSVPVPVRR